MHYDLNPPKQVDNIHSPRHGQWFIVAKLNDSFKGMYLSRDGDIVFWVEASESMDELYWDNIDDAWTALDAYYEKSYSQRPQKDTTASEPLFGE